MSKQNVPQLIKAAKAYCAIRGNHFGGSLHIVLDDGNIKDSHIKYCIDYANSKGDNEGVLLGQLLLEASMTQRKKLVRQLHTNKGGEQ